VRLEQIESPYWAARFTEARRFTLSNQRTN